MRFESDTSTQDDVLPLHVPEIRGNEWKYLKECLDTNWVSSAGPFVDRFERLVAARIGAAHAVATSSGTAALHIALLVAGVQPDDEVLVPTLTFIAAANAVHYVGGRPVFIDAEPDYWQMDPEQVVTFLEQGCRWQNGELRNRSTGRRVRAILPVHSLGHPVDMDPILAVARKYHLPVIEDAAESLGAAYKRRAVGQLGDIACLSFNGNKIITTGGGGMILTDREDWAQKARYLTTQAKDDPLEYVHSEIGFNYRLTNVQAALGCAQLEQLDPYLAAKRRVAATYRDALTGIPGLVPMREAPHADSSFWLFTILVEEAAYGMDSRTLLRHLNERRIQCRPLWRPLHLNPPYRSMALGNYPVAESLSERAVSLPSSVGLTEADFFRVVSTLREGVAKRT